MANQMISAFTPSLMSPEELETIFVQRQDLAQEIFEKIILSATTQAKHYALLIGMRGMGKTHLVALIYYRLLAECKKTTTLKDKLVVAWLREEEWGVDNWLDLVTRILRALAVEETESKSLLEELKRISVEDSIPEAAANAKRLLKKAIGNRTLLLIMENLDDLFKGLGEAGQQQFRSFLQEEQCCTILATTPAIFNDVKSRSKPFFGFFNPHYLDKLSVPEAIEMLGKIATLGGQEDLARFLQTPLGRSRVRAVHHLAGGNPRVYMLFSQFITRDALDSLVLAFMEMLDSLTPYYQSRMRELSNQQRKIIELLVDKRSAVMVKEIATDCYIDPKTAASQLRDLKKMGYVEATADKRESLYELREVLMRLCLEVKKQRGTWVEIFVEFLRIWYPLSERESQLESMRGSSWLISDEHLERALLSEEDPCFISSRRDLLRALKEKQQSLALDTLEELRDSGRLTDENYEVLLICLQDDQYSDAQELFVLNEELEFLEKLMAGLELSVEEKYEEAIVCFDRAIKLNPDNDEAWYSQGDSLDSLGRYEEAIVCFDRAIKIDPDNSGTWYSRGYSLRKLGKYEESVISFDRAIELNPDDSTAWHNRGYSLRKLGKYEESVISFDRAIELNPDDSTAWHNRGYSLENLGKYEEAIASYKQGIELNPDDYCSLHNQSFILINAGKYEEALASCDRSIELKADYEYAWNNRGISLDNLGRYEEAIASYDRAIELKPDYEYAWSNRGYSLRQLMKYKESIASYDRAIEIKTDDYYSWYNRGLSLSNLERYEEAISSYDRAIELKPDNSSAWHSKGWAYFKWGKYIESLGCTERAIEIDPDKYGSWHNKGLAQFVIGNYDEALITWRQTFHIFPRLKPSPDYTAVVIQEFIEELIPRFSLPNSQPQLSKLLTQIIPIYQSAQVIPELSTALVNTLSDILAPNISDYTAAEWLALWQNLLGNEAALEMPLRLMKTAIEYKKQPDRQKRLWLGLAKEERSILDRVLGLDMEKNMSID